MDLDFIVTVHVLIVPHELLYVVAVCLFLCLFAWCSQCSSMSDGENYECYGEGVELDLEDTPGNIG